MQYRSAHRARRSFGGSITQRETRTKSYISYLRAPAEAEHLLAVRQCAHVHADRLHPPGRVDPGHPGLRLGQPPFPHEPRDERVASHDVPVVRVERGGVHPNQYVAGPTSGGSVSTSCRISGGPNRSWTIALIRSPRVIAPVVVIDANRRFEERSPGRQA